MEEMVEVRKEVSDMPCGNAIPAEDAGHQTEKDVAGRESDRVPAPEMNPKVQLELLSGEGRKKAIGAVVIYNAVTIRGISVVENSKKNPFVKMPRAPKGARTKHSDIAYPINRAAREMLYSAVLQEYDRREVFEPLQLSARGMDDRTGIQTILDDVCNRRFDLLMIASMDRLSYDKEEVKAFLAEMDLNGISIFNVGSNTVTLASGWDLMAFIRQMISPENGGDAQ